MLIWNKNRQIRIYPKIPLKYVITYIAFHADAMNI